MKIRDKFFKLNKKLSLYRVESGEMGSWIRSWDSIEPSYEYARKTMLDEIFYYEDFEEEWELREEKLGFKRQELIKMPFEDFLVAVREYYVLIVEYEVEEYVPGAGLGGAIPYTD